MGLADAFGAEDRVQVKFSTFYELVKGCTQRDQMLNAIRFSFDRTERRKH